VLAVTTPVNVPAAVGVPVTAPVVELSERPPGSAPEVTLKVGDGDPLAVYVCVYATPKVPPAGAALVNAGTTPGVTVSPFDAALGPAELLATTEHVYVVPFARPVTTRGEPGPDAPNAPGLHVAV
jgi:hypothetical protein